jgi:hypothetical protein
MHLVKRNTSLGDMNSVVAISNLRPTSACHHHDGPQGAGSNTRTLAVCA